EIADTLQARTAQRRSPIRRLVSPLGSRNECMTAREREYAFLQRRLAQVSPAQRIQLQADIEALRKILEKNGHLHQPPAPVPSAPSPARVNEFVDQLRRHELGITAGVQNLDEALTRHIQQLLQTETDLALRAMAAGNSPSSDPVFAALSRARAAYEAAQQLVSTAGDTTARADAFTRALHTADQLYMAYEQLATTLATVPPLPLNRPSSDLLRQHAMALMVAATELTSPSGLTPQNAQLRQEAAASAVRAAQVYAALSERLSSGLHPETFSQLVRLAQTHEQHYRMVTLQQVATGTNTATELRQVHEQVLAHIVGRRVAGVALRATIESLNSVVDEQGNAVRAYQDASRTASRQAVRLAPTDAAAAHSWFGIAENLSRVAGLQQAAEQLAVGVRDAHQALADLIAAAVAGNPVDVAELTRLADAADAALNIYQNAIGTLPPATPPALPPFPALPDTPLNTLRAEADRSSERFGDERQRNSDLGLKHVNEAVEARQAAVDAWKKAVKATQERDAHRDVRVHKAELEANLQGEIAELHNTVADKYRAAADAAEAARDAADALIAALDQVDDPANPRTPEVEAALAELAAKEAAYEAALKETAPPDAALTGTLPAGPIANIAELTKMVNGMLRAKGLSRQFSQEQLTRAIRQAFRTAVSPDGMVLRINVGGAAELRLKLKLSDLQEVLKPGTTHSETMLGVLPQGGGSVSRTSHLSRRLGGSVDLMTLPRLFMRQDSFWKNFVLRTNAGGHFGSGTGNSAQEYALDGAVEDNRGLGVMFDAEANWEIELRTAPGESSKETVPAEDGTHRQRLWVSHVYLTDLPDGTIQLDPDDRQKEPFPTHVPTGLTGLTELVNAVAARLGVTDLGSVGYNQIVTMMNEFLPSQLEHAINDPTGLSRDITVKGRGKATVTVKTTVVPGGTPVGTASTKHHQERLRVGFSNSGQSGSVGTDSGYGLSPGFKFGDPMDPTTPEGGLNVGHNSGSASSGSVNSVAIHPSVQRWAGHTQGYQLTLQHTVTVRMANGDTFTLDTVDSTGLFRIPESAAYRYGLPVDSNAEVGINPDGSRRLRDDPDPEPPPGKKGELPSWFGSGPGQLRGAGNALVQEATGMDQVRADVEKYLRDEGVLPRLENGKPKYSLIPWVRASQRINEQLVADQFSAMRLETGYDQAAQEGIFIDLVHHRMGLAARHITLRIKLDQDLENAVFEGVTDAEPVVNLDIASDTYGVTSDQNRSTSGGGSGKIATGTFVGAASPGVSGSLGSADDTSRGDTVNQVTLMEGARSAVFRVPHAVRVERMSDSGTPTVVAEERPGSTRVVLLADQLPNKNAADGHPLEPGRPHPTAPDILKLFTP
ncbi:MAG: hypothetical protein HOY71_03390, partial [Nonomuraea sp.]|nr:hypothetical protein [Nonomuraea sp.]